MPSRRQEILGLAADLFSKNGVQNTSMRDLADAAGILPSSLYSHSKAKKPRRRDLANLRTSDTMPKSRLRSDAAERIRAYRVTWKARHLRRCLFHSELNYLASLRARLPFDFTKRRRNRIRPITDAMKKPTPTMSTHITSEVRTRPP